jgi:hypothetical protein
MCRVDERDDLDCVRDGADVDACGKKLAFNATPDLRSGFRSVHALRKRQA